MRQMGSSPESASRALAVEIVEVSKFAVVAVQKAGGWLTVGFGWENLYQSTASTCGKEMGRWFGLGRGNGWRSAVRVNF